MSDVVADLELAIVDPDRPILDGRPFDLLSIARDPMQDGFDLRSVSIDVDAAVLTLERARFKEGQCTNVHRLIGRLGPKESRVLR